LEHKKLLRESDDGTDPLHQQPSSLFSSLFNCHFPTNRIGAISPSSSSTPLSTNLPYSSSSYSRQYFRRSTYSAPLLAVPLSPPYIRSLLPSTNPSLIFIDVLVHGKPLRTMIDTGASRCFITKRALRRIHYSQLHSSNSTAQLGDGHTTLDILGEVHLVVQVRDVFTTVCALVTQRLNSEFILGGDWCINYGVRIDYDMNQISIRSPSGRTFVPYAKQLDTFTLNLHLTHLTTIPPREACTVQAKVELSSADTVYFHPDHNTQHDKSIVISPSLLHVHNYATYLKIYNPTPFSQTLPTNTLLGRISHTPSRIDSFHALTSTADSTTVSTMSSIINAINIVPSTSIPSDFINKLLNHITDLQRKTALSSILQQHITLFDCSVVTQANTPVQHTINTGDHPPISCRPYPKTIQQRREIQAEIQKMLANKQIRPSNSPWSSPVIIHKKKDGGIRFLVDYRKLNSVTKKDSFPQPTTEELLQRLGGHNYYSKFDLKSGYFQLPIHEQDKEKTAFITQDGLWEFNVLPQGVMNGPPTFQRTMHNLIGNGRWDYVMVYLDDILIFSRTFDEHKQHLHEILSLLSTAKFQVNPEKCTIATREINFLSHTINEHGIKPNGDKIKAILDLPSPRTLKEANEFLGKINWYRKFIPNFAQLAAPLYKVTNKTKQRQHEFHWSFEQQHAFEQFKQVLTTYPLFLEYPDLSTPFTLTTDASDIGVGGILRQDTPVGTKINYFKSRLLTDTERKYDTFEKEALAIYWCISDLRSYIGDSNFIVETDHKPLENFHLKQINNKRVMNWLFKLQDIIPQIVAIKYRKGANNSAADYISRHFPPSLNTTTSSSTNFAHPNSKILVNNHSCNPAPFVDRISKSQHAQSIDAHPISAPAFHLHSTTPQHTAVTTRAQAKLIHQPCPSTIPPLLSPPIDQDLCSDPPSSQPLHDFSWTRLRTEQRRDSSIQHLIANLRNKPQHQSFRFRDGMLFKILHRNGRTLIVPYIPSSLISELLYTHHDHPLSGHFGIMRTWHNLRNKYYWPNMKHVITQYIKSCRKCSQFNVTRQKPPGLLHPIEPPDDVFRIIGMDWWGPTQTSLAGNRYVLVITDRLSNYVIARASPTNTAQDTARILMEDLILIHGPPDKIITDQGLHFNNELLRAISILIGSKQVFSTTYHPQTNGQTERWNSTFATQLAKYCNTDYNNWDIYLPSIVYAYNHGVHQTTGFTPYQLAFGRTPRNPFDSPHSIFRFSKPSDYYRQVLRYKEITLQQAKAHIHHQQRLSKIRYDLNRPSPTYHVGDLVWTKVLNGRSKLTARYTGPARIVQVLTPVSFLVSYDDGRELQVHSSSLRPVYHRT
jgi:transposase InsO family protein